MADPQKPKLSTRSKVAGGLTGAAAVALTMAVGALVHDEGKRNVTYADIVGVPTACYGHTGAGTGTVGTRHSDAQCETLLSADAQKAERGVLRCSPGLADRPNQLAAATRLTFNIGVSAYCRSTVMRRFNAGDWRGGCDAFLMWDRAGGRVIRGLQLRRQRERAMCMEGL